MQSLEKILKSTPGIDYEGAMKRMSDNTVFYAELLRLFFKDNVLDRLEEAIDREDYQRAVYEAHGLKGTASNLGLIEIGKIAAQIHLHLKNNEVDKTESLLYDLRQAYQAVSDLTHQL